MQRMTKVGVVSQRVIDLLNLTITAGTPIYIGESNISHMLQSHPGDYQKYKEQIPNIIEQPDYVGLNPSDNSLEYIKLFVIDNESVKVAVRVSHGGKLYVRTLYARDLQKMERFVKKGYLLKY